MNDNSNPCPDLHMGENEAIIEKLKEITGVLSQDRNGEMCAFLRDRHIFVVNYLVGSELSELEKEQVLNRLSFDPYRSNLDINIKYVELSDKNLAEGFIDFSQSEFESYHANGEPFSEGHQLIVSGHVKFKNVNDKPVIDLELNNSSNSNDVPRIESQIIYGVTLDDSDLTDITFCNDAVLIGPDQTVILHHKRNDNLSKSVKLAGHIKVDRTRSPVSADLYLRFRDVNDKPIKL